MRYKCGTCSPKCGTYFRQLRYKTGEPQKKTHMDRKKVDVLYDRRKEVAKKGVGTLEVRIYFDRASRKHIAIGKYAPDEWEAAAQSLEAQTIIKKCEQVISVMDFLNEEMSLANFDKHYYEEENKKKEEQEISNAQKSARKDFIKFCEETLAQEDIKPGTRKHKQVVIDSLKAFGKLKTYGDLTAKNILAYDRWLHNGERSDVTIYGYHKRLKKWVGELAQLEEIPRNPYKVVSIARGKCKERQPLLESELKKMRDFPFNGKLERVRDLFIFSAYTGLAFCDTQSFDYNTMTIKEGKMTFIDGNRIKTDTKFFTPILGPAMDVLKKYDYELPHLSNQKANDYLHLIQAQLGITKNLTFHVARHSFATLALAHDVPIENVARMLGHEYIRTTQIYAKVLRTTIERHATALQGAIL